MNFFILLTIFKIIFLNEGSIFKLIFLKNSFLCLKIELFGTNIKSGITPALFSKIVGIGLIIEDNIKT